MIDEATSTEKGVASPEKAHALACNIFALSALFWFLCCCFWLLMACFVQGGKNSVVDHAKLNEKEEEGVIR